MAHEIMNHINRKKKGKCREMALKLDMSKAYDRVEWGCLKQIMAKLGFHEDWIPPGHEMCLISHLCNMVKLFLCKGYAKGTLYHRTCSWFMLKDC